MAVVNVPPLYQGEDKIIRFTLWQDEDKTVPYNLNLLPQIIVWLYDSSGTVIERYSKVAIASPLHNTADFDIVDAVNGIFEINLRSEKTVLMCSGLMAFELKFAETNADFTNNKYKSIARQNIYMVQSSKTANQTI